MNARLLVVSCPHRKPIQEVWRAYQRENWPDCPLPIDMLSPEKDIGWNANLLAYLDTIDEDFLLLMLDDHFPAESEPEEFTASIRSLVCLMSERPDIGMTKVQAQNAHPPEVVFSAWPRLREYDRDHHPFKRTNLVPTLFRTTFLKRLVKAVLAVITPELDKGRDGALHFEVIGTLLTENSAAFPERILGIHRPLPDYSCAGSLFRSVDGDAVREGRLKLLTGTDAESLRRMTQGIAGLEAFA